MINKLSGKILMLREESHVQGNICNSSLMKLFRVITITDKYKLIDLAKTENPDLIIIDFSSNYKDGIELCKRIRADKELENIGIFLLSSINEDYVHILGLEAGADDYIIKPINTKILIRKITALLRRKSIRC